MLLTDSGMGFCVNIAVDTAGCRMERRNAMQASGSCQTTSSGEAEGASRLLKNSPDESDARSKLHVNPAWRCGNAVPIALGPLLTTTQRSCLAACLAPLLSGRPCSGGQEPPDSHTMWTERGVKGNGGDGLVAAGA